MALSCDHRLRAHMGQASVDHVGFRRWSQLFQQLSVVRTAFARPRMDLRTEERAGASGPVQAIRSKRFFEGAQTGRRAAALLFVPRLCAGLGCQRTNREKTEMLKTEMLK